MLAGLLAKSSWVSMLSISMIVCRRRAREHRPAQAGEATTLSIWLGCPSLNRTRGRIYGGGEIGQGKCGERARDGSLRGALRFYACGGHPRCNASGAEPANHLVEYLPGAVGSRQQRR